MTNPVYLDYDDPTVFAKCGGRCSRLGKGSVTARIYYKAYPRRMWARGPVCENCKSPMVMLYQLEEPVNSKRKAR